MQLQEQYKLFLGHANNLTERRQKVTATYLSVNAAIIGIVTFVLKDVQVTGWNKHLSMLMLLLAGIFVCDLWRRVIKKYSTLIGWWYAQVRNIEEEMNERSEDSDIRNLVQKEYKEVYHDESGKPVNGLTYYETRLTWIFTLIYGILGILIVTWFVV